MSPLCYFDMSEPFNIPDKVFIETKYSLELLGHADVKTTEIYAHVAKGVGAMGVVSPLDRL